MINAYAKKDIVEKHDGYTSLALIYASFTISNFFVPPIIQYLSVRRSLVLSALIYAIFEFGFLILNRIFLFGSSLLLGFGAAVIWTAQGKYLSLNSNEETAGRHSGIFWATSQACLISGGIFMFIVFKNDPRDQTHEFEDSTVKLLYGVFTVVTLCGALLLAFLRTTKSANTSATVTVTTNENENVDQDAANSAEIIATMNVIQCEPTYIEVLRSTWDLAFTRNILVMSVVFMYTGIVLSFWSSVYPTCIASTLKLSTNNNNTSAEINTKGILALNAILQGIGQASAGLLFGILNFKNLSRRGIVLIGTIVHLISYVTIFVNIPASAPLGPTEGDAVIRPNLYIALFSGFMLGFGDACWNTQVFAFLLTNYQTKSSQAFALFKFYQSLLTCAAFVYSSFLLLQWHLLILTFGVVLATFAFSITEKLNENNVETSHIE